MADAPFVLLIPYFFSYSHIFILGTRFFSIDVTEQTSFLYNLTFGSTSEVFPLSLSLSVMIAFLRMVE